MVITKKAYAKINLTLDVLGKRNDGYHNIVSVMQTLKYFDTVTLQKTESGISVEWNRPEKPDEKNTAYRAAAVMQEKYNIVGGVNIKIDKQIPIAAGLGGGSADAAAVIEGINELYELNIDTPKLIDIGKEIGADVPFCIFKGAAIAEGIGERLVGINSRISCRVVVAKPDIDVSTKKTYDKIDGLLHRRKPRADLAARALEAGDIKNLCCNLHNALELVTADEYPLVMELKRKMTRLGACGSLMSGSGPAVYGVFESALLAENAFACIKSEYPETFTCGFYYP